MNEQAPATTAPTTRDRTVRHYSGLNDLLERRSDLAGVVPMADLIRESASWAA